MPYVLPRGPLVPVLGKSAVVRVVSGVVTVTPRGGSRQPLTGTSVVPFGATVDATAGRLDFKTATDASGATEHSEFYGGAFVARSSRSAGRVLTILRLTGGDLGRCPKASAARSVARASRRRRRPKRLLWGNGKGKYRTEGRTASATVRGTIWLTEDRCDGTFVRVVRGVVRVRDRFTGQVTDVRAGRSILVPRH